MIDKLEHAYIPQPATAQRRKQIEEALAAIPPAPWIWFAPNCLTTGYWGMHALMAALPTGELAFRPFRHDGVPRKLRTVREIEELGIENPIADWIRDSPAYVADLLAENDRLRAQVAAGKRIEALGLENRTYRILTEAGLRYVGQLLTLTEEELYEVRNMGTVSMANVKECLRGVFGLALRQGSTPAAAEETDRHLSDDGITAVCGGDGLVTIDPDDTTCARCKPTAVDPSAEHHVTATRLVGKHEALAAAADLLTTVVVHPRHAIAYRIEHPADCNRLPYGQSCAFDLYMQTHATGEGSTWPQIPGEFRASYRVHSPTNADGEPMDFQEHIRWERLK
jgi:hypothetical protein